MFPTGRLGSTFEQTYGFVFSSVEPSSDIYAEVEETYTVVTEGYIDWQGFQWEVYDIPLEGIPQALC